jgi:hypothetical protein
VWKLAGEAIVATDMLANSAMRYKYGKIRMAEGRACQQPGFLVIASGLRK